MTNPSAPSLNEILRQARDDLQSGSTAPLPYITGAMLLCPGLSPDQAFEEAQRVNLDDRLGLLSTQYKEVMLKKNSENRQFMQQIRNGGNLPKHVEEISQKLSLWKDIKDSKEMQVLDDTWLTTALLGVDPNNRQRLRHLTFSELYEQAKAKNKQADSRRTEKIDKSSKFREFTKKCEPLERAAAFSLPFEGDMMKQALKELKELKRASLLSPSSEWCTVASLVVDLKLEELTQLIVMREMTGRTQFIAPLSTCNNNISKEYTDKLPVMFTTLQTVDTAFLYTTTYFFMCASFWSAAYFLSQRHHTVFPLNYRRLFLICLAISTVAVIFTLLSTSRQAVNCARNVSRPSTLKSAIHDHFHRQRAEFISKSQDNIDLTFATMIDRYQENPAELDIILLEAKEKLRSQGHMFTDGSRENVISAWRGILTSWTFSREEKILQMAIAPELHKEGDEELSPGLRAWVRSQQFKIILNTPIHLKGTGCPSFKKTLLVSSIMLCTAIATLEALVYFIAYKIAHRAKPDLQEKMLWLIVFSVALFIHLTFTIRGLMYNPYEDNAEFKLGSYDGWNTPCEESSSEGTQKAHM